MHDFGLLVVGADAGAIIVVFVDLVMRQRAFWQLLKHFQTNIAIHDAPERAEINAGEETG